MCLDLRTTTSSLITEANVHISLGSLPSLASAALVDLTALFPEKMTTEPLCDVQGDRWLWFYSRSLYFTSCLLKLPFKSCSSPDERSPESSHQFSDLLLHTTPKIIVVPNLFGIRLQSLTTKDVHS